MIRERDHSCETLISILIMRFSSPTARLPVLWLVPFFQRLWDRQEETHHQVASVASRGSCELALEAFDHTEHGGILTLDSID